MSYEELKDLVKEMHGLMKEMSDILNKKASSDKRLFNKIKVNEDKVKLALKAIVKHDSSITTIDHKVTNMQTRSMRKNLIISGIKEKSKENCKVVANKFFKDKLKIDEELPIATAHRLGDKSNEERPLIVQLTNQADKGKIFQHVKNLKDLESEVGAGYFVNEQLPPVKEERKRLEKDKIKINKTLISAQQQDLKWDKGKLQVDGEPFSPKNY